MLEPPVAKMIPDEAGGVYDPASPTHTGTTRFHSSVGAGKLIFQATPPSRHCPGSQQFVGWDEQKSRFAAPLIFSNNTIQFPHTITFPHFIQKSILGIVTGLGVGASHCSHKQPQHLRVFHKLCYLVIEKVEPTIFTMDNPKKMIRVFLNQLAYRSFCKFKKA